MDESVRPAPLQTVLDIAIAPSAAFARLRAAPTWVWAFISASALAIVAGIVMAPAFAHALSVQLPAQLLANPQFAQLPADQRNALIAKQLSIAQTVTRFSFIFVPFGLAIGCALAALIMLIANAMAKGEGTFKTFWAVAVNAAVVNPGLGSIALMAIVLIRGADSFSSPAQIVHALPGLGSFVPAGAKAAAAYCDVLNVFAIWNAALLAAGMIAVARLPRGVAIGTAAVILLGAGLFPLAGALAQK